MWRYGLKQSEKKVTVYNKNMLIILWQAESPDTVKKAYLWVNSWDIDDICYTCTMTEDLECGRWDAHLKARHFPQTWNTGMPGNLQFSKYGRTPLEYWSRMFNTKSFLKHCVTHQDLKQLRTTTYTTQSSYKLLQFSASLGILIRKIARYGTNWVLQNLKF